MRWRLTLMTAMLIAIVCLLLNLFISHLAIIQLDEMQNYMIKIAPNEQDSILIGIGELGLFTDLTNQIQQAKNTFFIQSIVATIIVMVLGGTLTYFMADKILAPLRQFTSHVQKIQAQNLSKPLKVPKAEDEIACLAHSFNKMLKRLDKAFMIQRQFSASAAHELRTPLAIMQTNLEVLQKKDTPQLFEYDNMINMMAEQTERLSHLVGTLLEMTELQTIQRNDRISLFALVEEVICDLTQVATQKKVTLVQKSGDAVLIGSDLLLYRAIYNLVENAIKYNRFNGTVTLEIHTRNNMVDLRVIDTGIGIIKEKWETIFDPFVCVDKSFSRTMGGGGLGLALVRDIANQHGGKVQIVQSSDLGTEIVLTLPLIRL